MSFGNGYAGLKLRLYLYSLIDRKDFKECKERYGKFYEKYAEPELFGVYSSTLKSILDNGYNVAIATKNVYAKNLLDRNHYTIEDRHLDKLKLVILRKAKKEKFRNMINEYDGKVCIIGNNLSDDIINSYRIGAPFIYIGKSKAINLILKGINYISFKLEIKSMYNRGLQLKNIVKIKEIFNLKKR